MAQATSTADSLAAALKGENKAQTVDLAQIKKEHPLLAVLQVNSSGQGPVVAYANYKDTAEINKYLSMREIQAELPKDLRLNGAFLLMNMIRRGRLSNFMLSVQPNVTDVRHWKVTLLLALKTNTTNLVNQL